MTRHNLEVLWILDFNGRIYYHSWVCKNQMYEELSSQSLLFYSYLKRDAKPHAYVRTAYWKNNIKFTFNDGQFETSLLHLLGLTGCTSRCEFWYGYNYNGINMRATNFHDSCFRLIFLAFKQLRRRKVFSQLKKRKIR